MMKISRLGVNIAANAVNRAWAFVSAIAFIPLYVQLLGTEAYGLVGFYSTLSALLTIADLGFSATLNRHMARLRASEASMLYRRDVLVSFEAIYAPITVLIAIVIWHFSGTVAIGWLDVAKISPIEVKEAIQLMGFAISAQLLSGLYHGGLMGLERQTLANGIQIAGSIVRHGGGILALVLISPTIKVFAIWQVISSLCILVVARSALWRMQRPNNFQRGPMFTWQPFKESLSFSSGMASMAVLSVILTQIDKIVVSKLLPLEQLGVYTIASAYAMVPMMLATPVSSAVTPRITGLIAVNNPEGVAEIFHRGAQIISFIILPVAAILLAFPDRVFGLWLGENASFDSLVPLGCLLLLGQLIQAISLMPYCLTLGHGAVGINVRFGVASVILVVPLSAILISSYGLQGGGVAWFLMNILTIPLYCRFVIQKYLAKGWLVWLGRDVGVAAFSCFGFIFVIRMLVTIPSNSVYAVLVLVILWLLTSVVAGVSLSEVRRLPGAWLRRSFV